ACGPQGQPTGAHTISRGVIRLSPLSSSARTRCTRAALLRGPGGSALCPGGDVVVRGGLVLVRGRLALVLDRLGPVLEGFGLVLDGLTLILDGLALVLKQHAVKADEVLAEQSVLAQQEQAAFGKCIVFLDPVDQQLLDRVRINLLLQVQCLDRFPAPVLVQLAVGYLVLVDGLLTGP